VFPHKFKKSRDLYAPALFNHQNERKELKDRRLNTFLPNGDKPVEDLLGLIPNTYYISDSIFTLERGGF
jgi:hypothetical protein